MLAAARLLPREADAKCISGGDPSSSTHARHAMAADNAIAEGDDLMMTDHLS